MTAPTKNYQVKFTRTAAHELKEIIAYIAKHNRTAAQRRLLLHPHYSALYIIQGNIVTIMHIWDNRRNWTHLF